MNAFLFDAIMFGLATKNLSYWCEYTGCRTIEEVDMVFVSGPTDKVLGLLSELSNDVAREFLNGATVICDSLC